MDKKKLLEQCRNALKNATETNLNLIRKNQMLKAELRRDYITGH